MLNDEIRVKRLSIIKLLYRNALEQSRKSDSVSFFSILSFHDAIEMFVKLVAEERNIKSEKFRFMDYWDAIPDLPLKESMRNLNSRRVNLKHHGLIPGQVEIEASRVNVTDFFSQSTPIMFGVKFEDISLIELVKFKRAKKFLIKAQKNIDTGNFSKSVEESTKAFYELLHEYKETKSKKDLSEKTHFDFIERVQFNPRYQGSPVTETDRKLEKIIEVVNRNFRSVENALSILALGIDYRKFAKFKILTPVASRFTDGKYFLEIMGERNWDKNNCEYLIDFVIECALKMQEVDFDHNDLDLTTFEIHISG